MVENVICTAWGKKLKEISAKVFQFQMVKPVISDWTEKNIILPESTTKFPGPYRYRLTPYCREMVNNAHSQSTVRYMAVMKSSQCGVTAGVIIPIICYKIDQEPTPILFTAADKIMAGRTIKERLDPILYESKLSHRIRPNAIKKQNKRTGDTEFSKEYAGGTLTAAGTSNPDTFRFYSAEVVLADDFDTAPIEIGNEGDITKLMQGRQKMYGDSALTVYVSTPTIKATSQIYKQYLKGTQKKWHWACPECGEYFPVEFQVKMDDGSYAGIVWKLDDDKQLIPESIYYRTQCCGKGKLFYKDKLKLNATGCWISTNPKAERFFESYLLNDLVIPPTFDSWEVVVKEFIEASPAGGKPNPIKLKAFYNQRLGLPFEEFGEAPKSTALMQNIRTYLPGVIPDKTSEADGNGKIILLSMACDLGGIHTPGTNEDVRVDWEILAHSQTGVTYSVDHGSIGTFKRAHEMTKFEKEDPDRLKWTYTHDVERSVWPIILDKIQDSYKRESGEGDMNIHITLVDTGFFEKLASLFIFKMQDKGLNVFGIKGRKDLKFRPIQRDTQPVRRSAEKPKQLYNIEVNQMKDDLAQNMSLQLGQDGQQPSGFMNFPQQENKKYSYDGYFIHYEGEVKKFERNPSGEIIGYKWEKKNSSVANHFWDVRVYNLAATHIWLDLTRQSDSSLKNLSWEEYVIMITE